jgi:hypothetical protein
VPLALFVHHVYFVVSDVNKIPSFGSAKFIAPETALTGRPAHAKNMVRLKKGLLSAKLWNEKLISDLKTLGFKQNPKEPCVLKYVNYQQLTVCLYVDDLFSTHKSMNALKWFHDQMCKLYGNIALSDGKILSYLGQTFDFTAPGKFHITMEGYVLDL